MSALGKEKNGKNGREVWSYKWDWRGKIEARDEKNVGLQRKESEETKGREEGRQGD